MKVPAVFIFPWGILFDYIILGSGFSDLIIPDLIILGLCVDILFIPVFFKLKIE